MDRTSLGDRMKAYERINDATLMSNTPVVIRVDGKAFHSYTKPLKNMNEPFHQGMHDLMGQVAMSLCKEIQNAKIAYYQSDEISIVMTDQLSITSQPWFGNRLQKIVSIAAARATATFNSLAHEYVPECKDKVALFDARAFSIPTPEVVNYMIWRQQDASRNSVQMQARSMYSHKQCHNKNNSDLQEMIFQGGMNWNDLDTWKKRGSCIIKESEIIESVTPNKELKEGANPFSVRKRWVVDDEIPIFTRDRNYIEERVFFF